MIKKLLSLLCSLLILSYSSTVTAISSTSYETQKKQSQTKERTIQQRKTIDFREYSSTRHSSTKKSTALVEVSLDSLIFAELAKLELMKEPYTSCSLITNPPLPADFGITAEAGSGIIDVYRAEFLGKAAQSSMNVSDIVDTGRLLQYSICVARYAEVVSKVLQNIKSSYSNIADLQQHIHTLVQRFKDTDSDMVKQIQYIDFSKCRFAGQPERIQCGQLYIEISTNPKLLFGKQKIYSDSVYMNVSSKFNIEKSIATEFARATEKATQTITEIATSQKESLEKTGSATVKTPSLPQ